MSRSYSSINSDISNNTNHDVISSSVIDNTTYPNIKLSSKQQIMFAETFNRHMEAGVSVQTYLSRTAELTENKNFKFLLTKLYEYVSLGEPLHKAMVRFPNAFPEFMISLFEAGEQSGSWTEKKSGNANSKKRKGDAAILPMLVEFLKRTHQAKNKLFMGIIYPAIILGALGVAIVIFSFFLLPVIKEIFVALQVYNSLSVLNKGLFSLGEWLTINYGVIPFLLVGLALLVKMLWDFTGKDLWQRYQIRIRGVRRIFAKMLLAESLLLLSVLYAAGLTLIDSLAIVAKCCKNKEVSKCLGIARVHMENGHPLAYALENSHFLFDKEACYWIASGHDTGKLDESMETYARDLFQQVDEEIDVALKLIEPAMIVVGGVLIGLLLVSFYSAIGTALANIR
jgi:type II secretory pathway component PulF